MKVLNSLPLEEIHIKRPVGIGLPYYDKKDQIHKPVPDRNY